MFEILSQAFSLSLPLLSQFTFLFTFIQNKFGTPGMIAFWILAIYFLFLVISKIVKALLETAVLVILPTIVLSGLGSMFLSYSFSSLLPIALGIVLAIKIIL